MRGLAVAIVLGGALACRQPAPALYPAGTKYDDGHGELALASVQLLTPGPTQAEPRRARPVIDEDDPPPSPDDPDDPDAGGRPDDGAYGGSAYAGYVVPPWRSSTVDRKAKHRQVLGLSGAIEGVVTWRGAVPPRLTTSCGAVEPLALEANQALAGVLIYIERVAVGRQLPPEGKSPSIGGLVVKRGCALAPAVQVAMPLPAALIVHGDARRTSIRVTAPSGDPRTYELRESGRVGLQVQGGVTRIDAADGSFGSAWIVGLDSPAYALTDDRGRFRLDELAAGTYEVTIWQPPVPALSNGALTYGAPLVVRRSVRVDAARTSRLDVGLGR